MWLRHQRPPQKPRPNRLHPIPASPLLDVDGVPDLDTVVEIDHVRDRHPHAAVRGGGAERGELVGAVDAGTVEDSDPAGLERVGRPWRDHLAGEAAGPGW